MERDQPSPRRDTRGILDPAALLTRVRLRRHEPAEALRPYIETYWFIDWDLPAPYASHLVPHPSVNLTFQWDEYDRGTEPYGEFTGVAAPGLYTRKISGLGRVCGAKFWPGAFRPFVPDVPVAEWTGRVLPYEEVFPRVDVAALLSGGPHGYGGPDVSDRDRVAALDSYLLALAPAEPDPAAELARGLVARIRAERGVRRVADLARAEGMSVRSLQRLFLGHVGVSPKWCILRYRIHEAVEAAGSRTDIDWAALAADLGYADQAHLVRDFTATVGVPPTAYPTA
ncbi:helix-turn-helix domain-containing protein [Streptomyces kunmingensis]|uniref:Helix-turn-helix domain-containing protein n=1 Tax=Streptomyces kunmingensis TaxID=68225 RepID=A0ABU6CQI4_9ACTN|nr:helix-turn-helix domain-containing protein [Streptomyces kunmingensis]MEB3966694.1 helix-turn-helix domain-containing protein [Streptomyces kunmingensis]